MADRVRGLCASHLFLQTTRKERPCASASSTRIRIETVRHGGKLRIAAMLGAGSALIGLRNIAPSLMALAILPSGLGVSLGAWVVGRCSNRQIAIPWSVIRTTPTWRCMRGC